jgi:hypothetical protein
MFKEADITIDTVWELVATNSSWNIKIWHWEFYRIQNISIKYYHFGCTMNIVKYTQNFKVKT